MAYSRYVQEFKDKDNNVYGVSDNECRESVDDLKNAFVNNNVGEMSASGYAGYESPMIINSYNQWTTTGNGTHIMIPVSPGDSVYIKAGTNTAIYAVLKDYDYPTENLSIPSFSEATGFTTRLTQTANSETTITMPNDAKYITFTYHNLGYSFLPASIYVNGWNMLKSVHNQIVKKEVLKLVSNAVNMFVDLSSVTLETGKYINSSNEVDTNPYYILSDYIELPVGVETVIVNRVVYINGNRYPQSKMVRFYDSNKTLLGTGTNTNNGDLLYSKGYPTAKYIRVNFAAEQVVPFVRLKTGHGILSSEYNILRLGISDLDELENNIIYALGETNSVTNTPYPNWQGTVMQLAFSDSVQPTAIQLAYSKTGRFHYRWAWGSPVAWSEWIEYEEKPKTYTVRKVAVNSGDYTSFTQCLLDLKDDKRPKTIEIWEGDYDIYQEYIDANVPINTSQNPVQNFIPYCVFIPENTHVIGKGIVRLRWEPTLEDNPSITYNQCYAVSTVNVLGSMTLENVEIYCKNGRYCIHDDTTGIAPYAGAVYRFINVKCFKYGNEQDTSITPAKYMGTSQVIGFGIAKSMLHYYENCEFHNYTSNGRAFYGHTNVNYNGTPITIAESGEIILKDCILDNISSNSVKLGNYGSVLRQVRVKFIDCSISGKILVIDEGNEDQNPSGHTDEQPNCFDLTLLNCGDVSIYIGDSDNTYTPKGYRTNITLT